MIHASYPADLHDSNVYSDVLFQSGYESIHLSNCMLQRILADPETQSYQKSTLLSWRPLHVPHPTREEMSQGSVQFVTYNYRDALLGSVLPDQTELNPNNPVSVFWKS